MSGSSFIVEVPTLFTKPTQMAMRCGNTILTGNERIDGNMVINGSLTLDGTLNTINTDSILTYDIVDDNVGNGHDSTYKFIAPIK